MLLTHTHIYICSVKELKIYSPTWICNQKVRVTGHSWPLTLHPQTATYVVTSPSLSCSFLDVCVPHVLYTLTYVAGEHNPPGWPEAGLHVTLTRWIMQEHAGRGLDKNPTRDPVLLLRSWQRPDRCVSTMNSFRCKSVVVCGHVHAYRTCVWDVHELVAMYAPSGASVSLLQPSRTSNCVINKKKYFIVQWLEIQIRLYFLQLSD